jgi:adenylate cyclase
MKLLTPYLPIDRLHAVARGEDLPEACQGSALFADISGFTPLAESLAAQLGPQRAAEELTRLLDRVYSILMDQVHRFHGSVIGFVGDAITCWFDEQDLTGFQKPVRSALRAATCALAMQREMAAFAGVEVIPGVTAALSVKIGISCGPARRFVAGDPAIQHLDTLAGKTLRQLSQAEGLAKKGEIVLAPAAVVALQGNAQFAETRLHPENGTKFALLIGLSTLAEVSPWPELDLAALAEAQIHPWVLAALYEQLSAGEGETLPELRPVTALFLRFSGIDYDHDLDAGQKLKAFIGWVQRTAARFSGYLIQLTIGDKGSFLYIVFGALVAHDDDSIRAVRAAKSLLAVPEALSFIVPQIGIASGPARTGVYGSSTRHSYGAIGGEVVLAARLMTAAPPGEMRCSYSVYRQASGKVNFEVLPPIRVKGRADLIRVYCPTDKTQPIDPNRQGEMVGRRAEIASLEKMLDEVRSQTTRILLIEGEAGIGKSRLVEAIKPLVRERGLVGLLGHGQSIEQQTPYRAWRDVFSSYFVLDKVTDADERRARVEALVTQLIPEHAQRLPVLNDVLGLGIPENELTQALDANLRQQNVLLVLTALLRAWTIERPLVLILEDAHWLDGLSWQLVLQVVRVLSLANAPLLFVVVNRPLDETSAGQKVLAELRALNVTQALALSTLAPDEIVALVAQRLNAETDALPAPLVELVQSRANGNPFFAEELVFNLRDTGVIQTFEVLETSKVFITGDLQAAQRTLSDTLHGLILSRLDRLPLQRQFVIKAAAVIGRSFAFVPLHHVVNRYVTILEQALKEHLTWLTKADFTFLEALEPDLTYLFKHILTQEAAYQTLLFAQRRDLHRLVAEWYEGQTKDEPGFHTSAVILPLLAYHYRYAEDVEKERYYLGLAGEAAEKAYANDAALGFYTRLLTLIPPQEQTETLLKRGKLFELVGRWDEAGQDYRAALALGEQSADLGLLARSQFELGNLFLQRGNCDKALTWLQRAQAGFETLKDEAGRCRALIVLGDVLRTNSDYPQARQRLELGLQITRKTGDQPGTAKVCLNLGMVDFMQGNTAQAKLWGEEALGIFQTLHDKSGTARAFHMLGLVATVQGDSTTMRLRFEQAYALSYEIGDKYQTAVELIHLGWTAAFGDEFALAEQRYAEALTLMQEIGSKPGIARALLGMGSCLWRQGNYALSKERLTTGLALYQELGNQRGMGTTYNHLGMLGLAQGDYVSAQAWFEKFLAYEREVHEIDDTSNALNNLAFAKIGQGDYQAARAFYQESLPLAREIQYTLGQVYILVGLTAIALHLGLPVAAARFSAALETWRAATATLLDTYERGIHEHSLAQLRAVFSPAELDTLWAQGAQLSLDQTIDEALRVTEGV